MAETFFIGDHHFGHRNIIRFEPEFRPYETIEEHDAALIDAWNRAVGPGDVVFHLGDLAWSKRDLHRAVPQLNGHIKLVMGNHDTLPNDEYIAAGVVKLYGMVTYKSATVLTHAPILMDSLRFSVNIHGHTHSHVVPDVRHLNVSVENLVRRYGWPAPVSWDVIEPEIKEVARIVRDEREGSKR